MPDIDHESGRIRYMPMVATDEQRRLIEKSALYGIGQVVLIAVNVGDLHNPTGNTEGLSPIGKEVDTLANRLERHGKRLLERHGVKIVTCDFFETEGIVTISSPVTDRAIEELSSGQALKEGE